MRSQDRTIRIRSDERVFLCGKTGSGKTFAARHICLPLRRLIVLDPKGRIDPEAGEEGWRLLPWDREARMLLRNGEPIRALVRAPIGPGAEDEWDRAYREVLNAGNATIYIDEVYGVIEGGKPSPYLVALWTRGRELGIGAIGASQRPSWIPMVLMSEAEHYFAFRLSLLDDRRRMAEMMGQEVLVPIPEGDPHGFHYARTEWNRPDYYASLPLRQETRRITSRERAEVAA